MSFFSSFYSFDKPPPQEGKYVKMGEYDIGCGGNCGWYITNEKVVADNFCVPYSQKRYAFILTLYNEDDRKSDIYLEFIERFPDYISGSIWFIAFSDDSNCILSVYDSNDGEIYAVDLNKNLSTYCYDDTGNPIFKSQINFFDE